MEGCFSKISVAPPRRVVAGHHHTLGALWTILNLEKKLERETTLTCLLKYKTTNKKRDGNYKIRLIRNGSQYQLMAL